jgi:hypothetical protein
MDVQRVGRTAQRNAENAGVISNQKISINRRVTPVSSLIRTTRRKTIVSSSTRQKTVATQGTTIARTGFNSLPERLIDSLGLLFGEALSFALDARLERLTHRGGSRNVSQLGVAGLVAFGLSWKVALNIIFFRIALFLHSLVLFLLTIRIR